MVSAHEQSRQAASPREAEIWRVLDGVADPEIPVVSVVELGMVRAVSAGEGGRVEVVMSPTYTGCPATDAIRQDVTRALEEAGLEDFTVRYRLTPPWTTDWITEEGREKLQRYGIAPPKADREAAYGGAACPRCGSADTEVVADFGSTPCKASMRCKSCLEPFEHFKCI
mgnify:CR=1 FL=1